MSGQLQFDKHNVPKAVKEQAKKNAGNARNIGYLTVTAAGTSNAIVIEQTTSGHWRAAAHVVNVATSAFMANQINKRSETELTRLVLEDQTMLDKYQHVNAEVLLQHVLPALTVGVAGLGYLLGKRGT
jgi:hypothetical protein